MHTVSFKVVRLSSQSISLSSLAEQLAYSGTRLALRCLAQADSGCILLSSLVGSVILQSHMVSFKAVRLSPQSILRSSLAGAVIVQSYTVRLKVVGLSSLLMHLAYSRLHLVGSRLHLRNRQSHLAHSRSYLAHSQSHLAYS